MKIVNILGGLGNQMFQYALAVALRHQGVADVLIDPRGFQGYPLHNGYELKRIFNVDIPEASLSQVSRLAYPLFNYRAWQILSRLPKRKSMVIETESMAFNPSVLNNKENRYLIGYWQTEKYFRDCRTDILNAFTFPGFAEGSKSQTLAEEISGKRAVSLHVRRGDYLKIGNTSGICTETYYKEAIRRMIAQTSPELFVIFSDGMDWCHSQFGDSIEGITVRYVDWNNGPDSFRDMQLMSFCSHNIIANSSFSWWGAWLNNNPDKIVIAPSRWMNSGGWVDIIPDSWQTVKV